MPRKISKIIIHCSATRPTLDIGAEEIRRWHMEDNGWNDIGYHYVITRDGDIEKGRSEESAGAHTKGQNAYSIGVCLVGGVSHDGKTAENNFTHLQWSALEWLMKDILFRYPQATIHGHREFASKDCPSFDVQEWIKSIE